jgi:fructokinase
VNTAPGGRLIGEVKSMTDTKPYDIVALGELLIDFTDAGLSPAGQRLYEQNPGGAPANVLCAAARLGMKTAFIGKVGADMQGRFLRGVLEREGIDVSGLVMSETESTTLAFVNIGKYGEREFSFCRKPGADTCLRGTELNEELLSS